MAASVPSIMSFIDEFIFQQLIEVQYIKFRS